MVVLRIGESCCVVVLEMGEILRWMISDVRLLYRCACMCVCVCVFACVSYWFMVSDVRLQNSIPVAFPASSVV